MFGNGEISGMKIYDGFIWFIVGIISTFTELIKIELTVFDNTFSVPGVALIIIGFIILFIAANAKKT
jgi:uncharacterized membrane protein